MTLPVLIWPHPRLQDVSWVVTPEELASPDFAELVANLHETLIAMGGVGLSAIQVGEPRRVFVTHINGVPGVYVNPAIQELLGEPVELTEGCLSLPGIYETVARHTELILTAMDLQGEVQTCQLEGLEAQCAQHEIEHLDGKLMVDSFGPVKRNILRRKIRKELKRRSR